MNIEHMERYRCRINMRPTFNGNPVKSDIAALNGTFFIFEAMWLQDEDDKYPGEWAMGDSFNFKDTDARFFMRSNNKASVWISSGDVEVLEHIPFPYD